MKRQDLLYPYLEECRDRPFAWASWDCCQFAGEWLLRLTGVDHRSAFPAYTDEDSARAILAESGGLIALVDTILPQIHPSRACEGDLVLVNDLEGSALGICCGAQSAYVGPPGILWRRTLDSLAAWRVE